MTRKTPQERADVIQEMNKAIAGGETLKAFGKRIGITPFTLSKWRKEFRTNPAPLVEVKPMSNGKDERTKLLEIENQRLKIIVANQALDIQALKEYCGRA